MCRDCLAGDFIFPSEIVLVDFGVVPLAGEFEGVVDILDALAFVEAAERDAGIRVGGIDEPRIGLLIVIRYDHQPDTAQAVMNIERDIRNRLLKFVNRMLILTQRLRIGPGTSLG
jgi:hypothetical protein